VRRKYKAVVNIYGWVSPVIFSLFMVKKINCKYDLTAPEMDKRVCHPLQKVAGPHWGSLGAQRIANLVFWVMSVF
jgi:hypothetical protein